MITISFSQAETYSTCKRKWAYRYVNKKQGIPSYAAIRGTVLHSQIEQYVKDKKRSSNRKLVSAYDYLDDKFSKGFSIESEVSFEAQVEEDISVRGFVDIYMNDNATGTVLDWKFSNKKPEIVRENYKRQLHLYAYMLNNYTEHNNVEFLYLFYPEYELCAPVAYKDEKAKEVYEWITKVAREILDDGSLEITGENQKPTPNKFCPWCEYRDVCPLGSSK